MRFSLLSLRRITSSTGYVPEIDGLRFLAILLVVVHHLVLVGLGADYIEAHQGPVMSLLLGGSVGVDLFFVLSGFILSGPFLKAHQSNAGPVSLRKFYLRRLTRLEPTYVIAMTLWLLVKLLYKHWSVADTLPHYFASLSYVHYLVYGTPSTLQPAAWSLEIEIQFYLLMPLIAQVFRLRQHQTRMAWYGVLIAGTILANSLFNAPYGLWLGHTLIGKLQFFVMGMLLADLHAGGTSHAKKGSLSVLDCLVAPALAAALLLELIAPALYGLLPLLLGLLVYCILRGTWGRRLFANPYLATVGGMCYTIYLFHNLVIEVLYERVLSRFSLSGSLEWDVAWKVGFATAVIFAACIPIYAFLERPFMNAQWVANWRFAAQAFWRRRMVSAAE